MVRLVERLPETSILTDFWLLCFTTKYMNMSFCNFWWGGDLPPAPIFFSTFGCGIFIHYTHFLPRLFHILCFTVIYPWACHGKFLLSWLQKKWEKECQILKRKAKIISILEEKLGLAMLYFGLLELYKGGNSSNLGMTKFILCTSISHTTHLWSNLPICSTSCLQLPHHSKCLQGKFPHIIFCQLQPKHNTWRRFAMYFCKPHTA